MFKCTLVWLIAELGLQNAKFQEKFPELSPHALPWSSALSQNIGFLTCTLILIIMWHMLVMFTSYTKDKIKIITPTPSYDFSTNLRVISLSCFKCLLTKLSVDCYLMPIPHCYRFVVLFIYLTYFI